MDCGFAPRIPIRTAVQTFPLAQANQVLAMLKRAEIHGAAGKAPKVALTACLRKLLVVLNALLKKGQPW